MTRIDENELPFKREWAYPFDDNRTIGIKASKGMINTLLSWKKEKFDAQGNKYKPEEHVFSLNNALTLLYNEGEITKEQVVALTKAVLEMNEENE